MSAFFSVVATLALLLTNAFFVASEFAIVKIRPTQLEPHAARGSRRAATALGLTHHLDAYLSANQLGITLASLGLGWLGEPVLTDAVEAVLGPLGHFGASRSLAAGVGFVLLTFLHVVAGELAPKSLAIRKTEAVSLWTAIPLRVFYVGAFPIIWAMNHAAGVLLRIVGVEPAHEAEQAHTAEELRLLLRREKGIAPGPRRLIDRMFDYSHRIVRHVMTLREDVVAMRATDTVEEALRFGLAQEFSRYPVLEGNGERVIGYVHMKDLARALVGERRSDTIDRVTRAPLVVRGELPLDELRRRFLEKKVHMAIVEDGAGAFVGIVTLEDLLEEFVGEIQDESDVGETPPILASGTAFELDGRVTLDVVAREVGVALGDVGDAETIGGYLRVHLDGRPRIGRSFDAEGYRLTVLDVRDGRVRRVRIEKVAEEPSP